MKHALIVISIVWLIVQGSGCTIVDPFLIALNLPLEVCALLNSGNSWNELETSNIRAEIEKVSTDYVDEVKATRVADITVYMPNPPLSGTASGSVSYALDGGSLTRLATFANVPFDSLKSPGISLVHSSLITYDAATLTALLNALQNPSGLPPTATITVQTDGSTTVTVAQGTKLCARIHYQVDVEI